MSEHRWAFYVRDVLDCCDGVVTHTAGLNRERVSTKGVTPCHSQGWQGGRPIE